MTESMIHVDLERVVGAVTPGEPRPRVGQRWVGLGRPDRDVEASGRNGGASQGCGEIGRVGSWAGRRRTDGWHGLVGIDADELVVAVGADISHGERGVGSNLL